MIWFAADSERSTGSKIVLGGVVALALGAVIYISLGGSGSASQQVNSSASAEPYICLADQHPFDLTPAAFDAMLRADQARPDGPDGSRGGALKLKCPKCGQFTAVKAVRCSKDQTIFPTFDAKGAAARCPKCGGGG